MNNDRAYNLPTPTTTRPPKNTWTTKSACLRMVWPPLQIYLRSDGFYDDVTFKAGAFCQDISTASQGVAIVNKNTLETGNLITLNSITPSLARMLQSAIKKEVLVVQGEPGNYTVVYKDPAVLGNITFSSYASGVEPLFRRTCQLEFTS